MSKSNGNNKSSNDDARNVDLKYPCMRDEYKWGDHRPAVPDSRVVTKENTVIHGLETDAEKNATEGKEYSSVLHYKIAVDLYNKAGDRRAELIETHPQLADKGHLDAVDFCYDKARELEEIFESLGGNDAIAELEESLKLGGESDIDDD